MCACTLTVLSHQNCPPLKTRQDKARFGSVLQDGDWQNFSMVSVFERECAVGSQVINRSENFRTRSPQRLGAHRESSTVKSTEISGLGSLSGWVSWLRFCALIT